MFSVARQCETIIVINRRHRPLFTPKLTILPLRVISGAAGNR